MKIQTILVTFLILISFTTTISTQSISKDMSAWEAHQKGNEYRDSLNYPLAIEYFKKAYQQYDKDSLGRKLSSLSFLIRSLRKTTKINTVPSYLEEAKSLSESVTKNDISQAHYYEALSDFYQASGKHKETLEAISNAVDIRMAQEKKDWQAIIGNKRAMSQALSFNRRFEEARKMADENYKDCIEKLGKDNRTARECKSIQGLVYGMSGDAKTSLEHYREVEQMFLELPSLSKAQKAILANTYNGFANNYLTLGDDHKAIPYFHKAHALASESGNFSQALGSLFGLARCQRITKQYDASISTLEKAEKIVLELFGDKGPRYNFLVGQYAITYDYKDDYTSSLKWAKKSLDLSLQQKGGITKETIRAYLDAGRAYRMNKNYKKADELYKEGLSALNKIPFSKDIAHLKSNLLENLYHSSMSQGNHDEGIDYLEQAIAAYVGKGDYKRGEPIDVLKFDYPSQLIDCFTNQGNFYTNHFNENNKWDYLAEAADIFKKTDIIRDSAFLKYDAKTIRDMREKGHYLYEGGIYSELQFFQKNKEDENLNQAFYYAEKSKSLSLLQGIREDEVKNISGVPDSILVSDKELKKKIEKLKNKLQREIDKKETSNQELIVSYENDLYELYKKQSKIKNILKKEYPKYYNLKYDYQLITIKDVQEKLIQNESTILIQYYLGVDFLNVFIIDKNEIKTISEKKADEIEVLLKEHYYAITDSKSNSLETTSQKLYQELVQPAIQGREDIIKNIIIIPNGKLSYIPFETLMNEKREYLMQHYNISYASSSTALLEQINKSKSNNKRGFAGFAPEYNQAIVTDDTLAYSHLATLVRDGEYDLPGAINEVKSIADLLNGDEFLAAEANIEQFKNLAERYKVLHLAMHSHLNGDNPLFSSLLFSNENNKENTLTAIDLYNLRLDADLVVLSACNTGAGKLKRGEGIMSLSRAFTYAGVPSTVMSLWKVPDASTSKIMISFYEYLKEGKPKDEALRLAKLDYLENIETPEAAHPFYWAGFVLSGDTEPIADSFSAGTPWIFYLVIASLFIAFAYLFLFRKRTDK